MLDRYVRRMEDIFGDRDPPKMFVRARAIQRVLNGESIEDVTAFEEFLELLATRGERELTVRLDRGEI